MDPAAGTDPLLRRNRLLALLDADSLAALAPHLERVALEVPKVLHAEGKPIRHVYFPVAGVLSLLAAVEGAHSRIEAGTVGREGMAGLGVFLGAKQSPGECFVQVDGHGWRMPAAAFVQACASLPALTTVLHRYAHALLVQMSQAVACNRVHSPMERCARWLLMTRDRVDGDTFTLKQEFLAQMLGERRVTVSLAASTLRERGMIAYRRGQVTLLDRSRLEAASCGCYEVVRREYDRMLAG